MVGMTRIDPEHKKSILKAYFKVCTLAYALRTSFGYTWHVAENDPHLLMTMVNDEENPAHRIAELLKESLLFVFSGTDPEQELVCDTMNAIKALSSKHKSPNRRKGGGGASTSNRTKQKTGDHMVAAFEDRVTAYDEV